jgi:phosphatidylserine decarboxylase
MSVLDASAGAPVFVERPTEPIVGDAYRFGTPLLLVSAALGVLGFSLAACVFLVAALFVGSFFRNPDRLIPGGEDSVVSPADGRVIEVGEIEGPEGPGGPKVLRVGIFLSVFNVHVNRMPLAGKVVAIERSGDAYLAAFNREAESRNVRCSVTLESPRGVRFVVTQITGLIARRIVCHPRVGDFVRRGDRYGLIRFGSRTDVVLPLSAEIRVGKGDRVRGGSTLLATLAASASSRSAAGTGSAA